MTKIKLLLLKISILRTGLRVFTALCMFLPAFLSPFFTDIPNLIVYFSGSCFFLLIFQCFCVPRYSVIGKILIDETGMTIYSDNEVPIYRPDDIKRIDLEYKGFRGGEPNVPLSLAIRFLPIGSQSGIGTIYFETTQKKKKWINFLAVRNIKKDLYSMRTLLLARGIDFRLIMW